MITNEELSRLQQSFPEFKEKKVSTKPCRIKFCGKFIRLSSGKTIWRTKGFAKTALLNHLKDSRELPKSCYHFAGTVPYVVSDEVKKLLRELESTGVVQYVEVGTQEFAEAGEKP
jgi:hypothetical protein